MKITNHYITASEPERIQRQAAIHRKCLLLIRGRFGQPPVYASKKAG